MIISKRYQGFTQDLKPDLLPVSRMNGQKIRLRRISLIILVRKLKWDSLNNYYRILNTNRKNAFQSLFEVKIDSINYTDSMVCKWYVHPNMGEKGMICHLPIKTVKDGSHTMLVNRRVYWEKKDEKSKTKKDTFRVDKYEIPFFKQNQLYK